VKQYLVVTPEHMVLQTPRSSEGKVLVNDLHREDIHKFLEDTDMERREIIRRYRVRRRDVNDHPNFIGSDNCENEFRHHCAPSLTRASRLKAHSARSSSSPVLCSSTSIQTRRRRTSSSSFASSSVCSTS
jgi:hypothetical protein